MTFIRTINIPELNTLGLEWTYTFTTYVAVMPYGETLFNIGSAHGILPDIPKPPPWSTLTSHHIYWSTQAQAMACHLTAPSHHRGPRLIYHYRYKSTLSWAMACHLTVPSHHSSQCWNILSESKCHSPMCSFMINTWGISPWDQR